MACNVLIHWLRLQVDMQDQDSIDVMIHQVSHNRALLQHPCIAGHASYIHLKTCCRWEASAAQSSVQPDDCMHPQNKACMCSWGRAHQVLRVKCQIMQHHRTPSSLSISFDLPPFSSFISASDPSNLCNQSALP